MIERPEPGIYTEAEARANALALGEALYGWVTRVMRERGELTDAEPTEQ